MPERKESIIVNVIVRAVVGTALIFFVNQFLMTEGIRIHVGINPATVATTGILGVPGVILLYGISFL